MTFRHTTALAVAVAVAVAGAVAGAALAVPAAAGAHATVSPMQPQGQALTSARTLYTLRVPNERPDTDTYRVTLFVAAPIREAISLAKKPGWDIRLTRRDTGRKDEEGRPVLATTRITWTARRGSEIEPAFFDEFPIRFQNPASAQKLCFPVHQTYSETVRQRRSGRTVTVRRETETVRWTGPESADTPASCVDIVAGA